MKDIKSITATLKKYQKVTGSDDDNAISDVLADLMHYCRDNDIDFRKELSTARWHFNEEVKEEKDAVQR